MTRCSHCRQEITGHTQHWVLERGGRGRTKDLHACSLLCLAALEEKEAQPLSSVPSAGTEI